MSFWKRLKRQTNHKAQPVHGGRWWSLIHDVFPGGWQRNQDVTENDKSCHFAVFACMSLVAGDISKLRLRVMKDDNGVPVEHKSSPYASLISRPNSYQNRIQFVESWLLSKLGSGNTYVLKGRDSRGVVNRLWVLDPTRVEPMVSEQGDVFYKLKTDHLSHIRESELMVPAGEIIHDRYNTLFHPLVGLSPIVAASVSIEQGLHIQRDSASFFRSRAVPGGVISAPGALDQETADELQEHWQAGFGADGDNRHGVAVLGDGLKFEAIRASAIDSQVIEQLRWTADVVCSVFHVPPYKIGVRDAPSFNSVQALNVDYFTQAVQKPLEDFELCLTSGLDLPSGQSAKFCEKGLLRMDSTAQAEVFESQIRAGILAPNEGRQELGRLPVPGGDTPYLQQQMWSLEQLSRRDGPEDSGDLPEQELSLDNIERELIANG